MLPKIKLIQVDINPQLEILLKHHGVNAEITNKFISTDLPDKVSFKATASYSHVDQGINSRLDVTVLTDSGHQIIESFGDFGETVEEALRNNFLNFCASSLHPLLAALGSKDPHTYDQITVEDWEINGKVWKAYIGNLVPKIVSATKTVIIPPAQFFDAFESGIKSQRLTKRLHWFRAFYGQLNDEITDKEFLMDNETIKDGAAIFSEIPVIPDVTYYTCRNFIVLKDEEFTG